METTTTVKDESAQPPESGDQTVILVTTPTTESTSSPELTVIELMDRIQAVQTEAASIRTYLEAAMQRLWKRISEMESKAMEPESEVTPVLPVIEPLESQKSPKAKSGFLRNLVL